MNKLDGIKGVEKRRKIKVSEKLRRRLEEGGTKKDR